MKKELNKTYSPKDFEDRLYKYWEESGYFKAERDPRKAVHDSNAAAQRHGTAPHGACARQHASGYTYPF